VAVVHLIAAADLDVRAHPDANAAPDATTTDALPKALRENHDYCVMAKAIPEERLRSVWQTLTEQFGAVKSIDERRGRAERLSGV
jgi:hypothetical protein